MSELPESLTRYPDPASNSAQLYERACRVMPGGNTRWSTFRSPYPLYAKSASGTTVFDEDGVPRFDLHNNFTSLIHGHSHPAVVDAVSRQVRLTACVAMPTRAEIQLAELLCERVPAVERVRFTSSGTEAVMLAIGIARAYTSRTMVAKVEGCYHGAYDPMEVSVSPTPENWGGTAPNAIAEFSGVPQAVVDDVLVLPFNDASTASDLISRHRDRLAAIVIDPLPRRSGYVPLDDAYVVTLRDAAARIGAVLISDEVISFRLGYRGATAEAGVEPGLIAYGKILGGGLPIGAVGGNVALMALLDPRAGKPIVPNSGTFNANPLTMAAGLAAMSLCTQEEIAALNTKGDRLRARLAQAIGENGQVTGRGSLFHIHLTGEEITDYRSGYPDAARRARELELETSLLNAGYLLAGTGGALSTVMSEADLSAFVETVEAVVGRDLVAA